MSHEQGNGISVNDFQQLGLFNDNPPAPASPKTREAVLVSNDIPDAELPQAMILTVKQPWATALIAHGKDVENRSWPTYYRGWVLVHAGKSIDTVVPPRYNLPDPMTLPLGSVIGAIYLRDSRRNVPSVWAEPGCWHWRHDLAFALTLPAPIPWRGMQGLLAAPAALLRLLPVETIERLRTKPI